MADISKIKTPDGTTYDIKDATARANSGVTGVKGNSESSYRTGNVNLTAENVGATSISVLPNDNDQIKTKYRIAKRGYTGSGSTVWYYPIAKLPKDNSGNAASLIVSGRIGGYVSNNMSYINALVWNRDQTGIALIDIAGTAANMPTIWGICDIVVYTNDDTTDTIYLKVQSYYTFDLDFELYQSTASFLYDGTYLTEEPTGTLNAQASTSTKRLELVNGKLLLNGTDVMTPDKPQRLYQMYTTESGYNKGRPASANINSDDYGGVRKFLATSSMTTGKPSTGDGHILQFDWDNGGAYGAQLSIAGSAQNGQLSVRAQNSSKEWGAWAKVYDAGHKPSLTEDVTGTLPVANGGTGKTTAKDAANEFMNALDTGSSAPVDADYYISQYVGGGTTTKTYHRRPVSALWEYIKGKISSVLGLTNTNYGGTSAKATADASGNTITSYYAPKSTAVTNVALSTNKITKTINGTTTDVVTAATTSAYGITKLSTSTSSTATDLAATPSAVRAAYNLADGANTTANTALSGVNGTLIYDHTYSITNGVATFVPHVYLKGEEVTSNYAASCFAWKYRLSSTSSGTPSYINLTTDSTTKGCTVAITTLGYGGYVLGTFTPPES